MSQEQLAAAAGLDRSFISMVERGIQSPNIVILLKIAAEDRRSAGSARGRDDRKDGNRHSEPAVRSPSTGSSGAVPR